MKKRKNGSAIIVAIVITTAFAAYVSSCIISSSNLGIMTTEYDKIIKSYYSNGMDDLNGLYNNVKNFNI